MGQMNDRKSTVMMISSMLIFGTIGIFRRSIPLSSAFLAFARGILGGLFLLAFMHLKKTGCKEKIDHRRLLWLMMTGALIGINWILLFEAYNHTTVAIATLCYYMQPTIVMLLSPLLFHEAMTGKKSLCALLAIIGMILISGVIDSGGTSMRSMQGILFGLSAAVFYAAVVILNKRLTGIDAYTRTTIQLLSAGMIMIPYLFLTGGFFNTGFNMTSLMLLLIVGIVHTGIAYLLYFGSMAGLKAQSIALYSYIDPVSALIFSALLLHEPISFLGIIGAVMIIGSALISEIEN